MANDSQLSVVTDLTDEGWSISAKLLPGSFLPPEVFIYENTGTHLLGDYVGVCHLSELKRLQIWKGEALPKFGNRFVRHSQAKITLPLSVNPDKAIKHMIKVIKTLSKQYESELTKTVVYDI